MDHLKHNANLVDALGSSLRGGDHALTTVPALLKRVLQEGAWREFVTVRGQLVQYEDFDVFVTTPPLKGLGGTVDLVERVVAGDVEAERLLAEARRANRPHGGKREAGTKTNNIRLGEGDTREAALRRLHREAPEIHDRVLAGEMTPYRGMVEAGFRRRKVSVFPDDPDAVARTLKKNMTPEVIEELVRLLQSSG